MTRHASATDLGEERRKNGEPVGLPIARLLPLVLGGLVLLAVLPVLVLGYIGAADNTSRLLRDRSERTINDVVDRIAAHLNPAVQQLNYVRQAVEQGEVRFTDGGDDFGTFVIGALAATPQVTGIGHILPDGTMRRHNRDNFGRYVEDRGSVPGVEELLDQAWTRGEAQWFSPTWSPILEDTILRLAAPLVDQGAASQGVVAAAITTSSLSAYLARMKEWGGPTAFILSDQDWVIAHPNKASPTFSAQLGEDKPLPRIDEVGDPILATIWTGERNPLTALDDFVEAEGHWQWGPDGASHAYVYRTIEGYGAEPWIVGVHTPGIATRRERWVVNGIAIGGGILLVLALAAAVVIGRRLGRPILGLASVAQQIEGLDFDSVQRLPRGPIREVNLASGAFERMAAGLRLFETYVPRLLVHRLVAAGAARPKSELRELTIMFTDLEGYSSFAAGRPAAEVADYLNTVLARIGPLIEANGGTIDNFIGDAVMAFWGAPEPNEQHVDAACQTALELVEAFAALNAERRAAGLPTCRLRIGLHTGRVVVGNVGFEGREHYTIIGEAVNVAQRIEQLGRRLGAHGAEANALVSEQVRASATENFAFERVLDEDDRLDRPSLAVYRLTQR